MGGHIDICDEVSAFYNDNIYREVDFVLSNVTRTDHPDAIKTVLDRVIEQRNNSDSYYKLAMNYVIKNGATNTLKTFTAFTVKNAAYAANYERTEMFEFIVNSLQESDLEHVLRDVISRCYYNCEMLVDMLIKRGCVITIHHVELAVVFGNWPVVYMFATRGYIPIGVRISDSQLDPWYHHSDFGAWYHDKAITKRKLKIKCRGLVLCLNRSCLWRELLHSLIQLLGRVWLLRVCLLCILHVAARPTTHREFEDHEYDDDEH